MLDQGHDVFDHASAMLAATDFAIGAINQMVESGRTPRP
jgi:hypothetical protein